jgi:myo-inositol-1(or 4)-monophosphatase
MKDFMIVARKAALKAGGILRENIHGVREITYKGDVNLVTEMDRRSERAVVETVLASFPDHGIIAEEETTMERIRLYMDHRPVDGTTNYAHGYPCFGFHSAGTRGSDHPRGRV